MSDGTLLDESTREAAANKPHVTESDGQYVPDAPRRRSHWRRSDLGTLLEGMADENETTDEIAVRLGRTVGAVRQMYESLLAGTADCPPEYAKQLQALKNRQPKEKPGRVGTVKQLEAVTAQYKALSQRLDRLERGASDGASAALLCLSVAVATNPLLTSLLHVYLTPRAGNGVLRLARAIRGDAPAAGEQGHPWTPLVSIGQGDSRVDYSPGEDSPNGSDHK